ncbi:glycosyltransferase family 2 protein [uncultured Bacteroides sp.]|uniref:glycosyltransferase family 2 protein n=1 Tax=uncultured Bacteroides sp. TaxID=162156 RepID=UPI002AA83E4E|nr:glycosyltransferase family 2 protein [uncultured Bacteroides sp.]
MYKVTIAIPVYNTQEYIKDSFLSALNQTFDNIEFLIIDDRGNDDSMSIVRELMNSHERGKNIRIITHKKNMGLANVRNTALIEATGDYLFFLDSDDTISEACIEFLYDKITKYPVDFVAASFQVMNVEEQILRKCVYPDLIIEGENKIAEYQYKNLKKESIDNFSWNKLYNLSFLKDNNINYIPGSLYEDSYFSFNLILKAKSCILTSKIFYNYKIRPYSIMQNNNRKSIPVKEIEGHLLYLDYYKKESLKYKLYPFYEDMLTQIMVICFDKISVLIDKRKVISENVSKKRINEILTYPIYFKEIYKFKHQKKINLLLFTFSKLPFSIKVIFLKLYFKLLRFYRKIR